MKRLLMSSLLSLAGAGLLLTASEAKAETTNNSESVIFSYYQPSSSNEWSGSFILQQFNPALGSLQSVYISATENVNISGTVSNTAAVPESFTFQAGSVLTVTLPGTLLSLKPSPLATATNYNLASGGTAPYGPATGSGFDSEIDTLPADLLLFTGSGTLTLPGIAQGVTSGGGGNITASLTTTDGATVLVQYTYAVPEPGLFALLAVGGAVMLLRRRR